MIIIIEIDFSLEGEDYMKKRRIIDSLSSLIIITLSTCSVVLVSQKEAEKTLLKKVVGG
jgi:hypothetical protein